MRKCLSHWSRVFSPAARGEDQGEAGCSPAAHGGPWWSRYPPTARGRPHAAAGECPKEDVTLWGAHTGAIRSLRTAPRGRDPFWSSVALKAGGKGSLIFSLPARGLPRTFTETVSQS